MSPILTTQRGAGCLGHLRHDLGACRLDLRIGETAVRFANDAQGIARKPEVSPHAREDYLRRSRAAYP